MEAGKKFFARKYPNMKYLAYFQAYTSTYDTIDRLKAMYEEALMVGDVVGLVIGTRPDCMPDAPTPLPRGAEQAYLSHCGIWC